MTQFESFADDTRSASEVLGIALLIGIVMIGVSVILLIGLAQVSGSQDSIETSQAEQGLTEFDSEALRVATGSTASQTVDVGLKGNSGTLDVEPESGTITVVYKDEILDPDPILNETMSLGTVVYENGDTTVGYQGGGVWRTDGDNSTMVSPPEISFEGNTLTFPIIKTQDGGSVHSDVQISSGGPTEELFPNTTIDQNLSNKINTGTLWITIESRYYEAWGEFFEEETKADVYIGEPEEGMVTVIFLGTSFSIEQEAGIIATSGPGEINMAGIGKDSEEDKTYIDSYDSSVGSYDETHEERGLVKSAGNIEMSGNARIEGRAESEGTIELGSENSEITDDACADESVYFKNDEIEDDDDADDVEQIGGSVECEANVPQLPPFDTTVYRTVEQIKEENDNHKTNDSIKDNRLKFPEESEDKEIELGPGRYYLEKIDMQDGETLVLNATNGEIDIAVEEFVRLDEGYIEVAGDANDSNVQVFIASRGSSGESIAAGSGGGNSGGDGSADHFYVNKGSQITVGNEASPRFQVIAPSNFAGGIRGTGSDETRVTGVMLAPTLGDGPSQFTVRNAELFGAVVTGNLTVGNKAAVHFDHGIIGLGVPYPKDALLDFLHMTRHEIEVEGA